MSDFENLKLENQICFPLYALSRKVIQLYKPLLDKYNLTYTQYITMLVLWEKENISLKELGEKLYLDSGTLSPVVKKLVKQGLVEKYRSQADERIVKLSLTTAGREMKKEAVEIPEKLYSQFEGDPETLVKLKHNLDQVLSQFRDES
ncbi:MarR family winged helix-turn-helix transcriptional regulator [Halanaerobium sp.]|jgi:DNA-binding MarR family transcriptional regulator|uniref:MarR family winged helix-turn-helix transcriptional regulator n=1 Tax=Halanaerobium sp. TaxID=1895664 RepID=UPI000DE60A1D|nr:MarR family transcriptional regulator [Halanaerobium sp.]PUU86304.1 MAG: MarR family transcriptional regulator [Halanaerobium sp.]PUU94078.1 MAG: MarR family transcriptional regulator [Halanaerobium sp.]